MLFPFLFLALSISVFGLSASAPVCSQILHQQHQDPFNLQFLVEDPALASVNNAHMSDNSEKKKPSEVPPASSEPAKETPASKPPSTTSEAEARPETTTAEAQPIQAQPQDTIAILAEIIAQRLPADSPQQSRLTNALMFELFDVLDLKPETVSQLQNLLSQCGVNLQELIRDDEIPAKIPRLRGPAGYFKASKKDESGKMLDYYVRIADGTPFVTFYDA